MRRLPEHGAEGADEVRLGDVGDRGHGAHVERLRVGPVHRIAGAQEAPIQVLDFAAHGATLRQSAIGRLSRHRVLGRAKLERVRRKAVGIQAVQAYR